MSDPVDDLLYGLAQAWRCYVDPVQEYLWGWTTPGAARVLEAQRLLFEAGEDPELAILLGPERIEEWAGRGRLRDLAAATTSIGASVWPTTLQLQQVSALRALAAAGMPTVDDWRRAFDLLPLGPERGGDRVPWGRSGYAGGRRLG